MDTGRLIFIPAGPSPRMRFKLVQCPFNLPKRCEREIFVFFKNVALCPVHGIVQTAEPWVEEGGNHDN